MSWSSVNPWGSSYYDNVSSGSWSAPQNEQYNPNYPSLNGTPTFFPSSAQEYEPAPPYRPSPTTSNRRRGNGRKQQQSKKSAWPTSKFHLIQINPDASVSKLVPPKPKEKVVPKPKPMVKPPSRGINRAPIYRGRGGQRGGGVPRMPNYRLQGNYWETHGFAEVKGTKPNNSKDDIPYVHLPDDAPAIQLTVSSDNIQAFHGFDSVFTTQHNFPVLIDGHIYVSCDHYYQIRKVTDLVGSCSDKLKRGVRDESGKFLVESTTGGAPRAFSSIAKEILKDAKVNKDKVDKWRNTKGLEAIQTALHAKTCQSAHLREALKESGDQILVHAFPRDTIYGTGCHAPLIKKWLLDLEKSGVKSLRIPATFPLTEETAKHCPVIAHGRNILGVIMMMLREKIRKNEISVVDMTAVHSAIRNSDSAIEPMDTNAKPIPGFLDRQTLGTF